ncbi:hypothetical protein L873DRAFT_1849165 [Choiromyces venosus 120613-1]|uniref:Uncharacterized protein n=1 Tax=Choiromyces venosus 120613-1 TaxID=1336337 RepID=A0A3N4IXQ8_9PEZI|nr:hypothetical protein L873DRAFT_1849165 [Choiromyces venosus 120613-1]
MYSASNASASTLRDNPKPTTRRWPTASRLLPSQGQKHPKLLQITLLHRRRTRSVTSKDPHKIYQSLQSNDSTLKIQGTAIKAPKLITLGPTGEFVESAKQPSKDIAPPPGFVLGGDVKLFGTGLAGRLYTFVGEAGKASDVKEIVTLGEKLLLEDVLKCLHGSVFGDVGLVKPGFTFRAGDSALGALPGLHFDAEVVFDNGSGLKSAHETLREVFGVKGGSLRVSGYLGEKREWSKALKPEKFSFKGVFVGVDSELGRLVRVTSIGVELAGVRREGSFMRRAKYDCTVGFYGSAEVEIPGSVVPLVVEYGLREVDEMYEFRLMKGGSEWVNVTGFKGLKLSDVQLLAKFPKKSSIKDIDFQLSAQLRFAGAALALKGIYSPETFYIQASIPTCTLDDLHALYASITGRTLAEFTHKATFKDLLFRIDASGLTLSGEVTIDEHRAVKAVVAIYRDGIAITGSLKDITLGAVTITKVELDVFIGRTNPGTTSRASGFSITGNVRFHTMDISVSLHTLVEGGQVSWTVYGELDADLELSHLAPKVKGTFLDLSLRRVAFIASNVDSPAGVEEFNVFNYPVRRGLFYPPFVYFIWGWGRTNFDGETGVQFCAALDRVPQLDHISGGRVEGLVLRAAYSDRGFSFGILFPAPVTLSLGPNVTSGPLSLEIVASTMPQLIFTTTLNVKVAGQAQPLVFTFGLKADVDSAEGFGQMTNYWVNPLGLSENVKIGPDLAFELGIIYAVLASTGAPSKIGFSGGLAIGEAEAQVAVALSANPTEQLVKTSLTRLSVTDLIQFASRIANDAIPAPPEDLFTIKNGLFYISTGATIGTTYYPAGASIRGDIELLGQETNFECTIGKTTRLQALFEDVALGPLVITGTEGGKPSTVIELGLSKQHILLDGSVKIFDFEASIHASLDILPKPDISLALRVAWADALEVELRARVIGAANFRDLKDTDFMIDAVLEQHILEYISMHGQAHFLAMRKVFEDGIEAAEEFFESAKEAIDAQLKEAEEAFEAARALWHEKEAELRNALHDAVTSFEEGVEELQNDFYQAEKDFEAAVYKAHQKLETARIDRAAAITSALIRIQKARRELQAEIMSHLCVIQETKKETAMSYGALLVDLKVAEENVQSAQDEVDRRESALAAAQKELSEASFYRQIDLSIKVGHHQAHVADSRADLLSAQTILAKAQLALEQSGYQSAISKKTEKKQVLAEVKTAGEQTIKATEEHLEIAVKEHDEIVQKTEAKIKEHLHKHSSTEKVALETKEGALNKFKSEKEAQISTLKSHVATLPSTPEFSKLEKAKSALTTVKNSRLELDAAKDAIKLLREKAPTAEHAESILTKFEHVFEIQRVELHGSLRDLIEKGIPLRASVKGFIAGKEIDFVLDYRIGETGEFVKGLMEKWWEEVSGGFMDLFDGEEDGEKEKSTV